MKDMLTKKELAKEFHMCDRTVQTKIKRIEDLLATRYTPYSVIRHGKTLMCNVVVFFDYLTYENMLSDAGLSKHAPKFNYTEAQQYLNFRKEEDA